MAAVYAGMAFVLGEVANNFFPALNIPDWAISFVVVLLLIGFPLVVALAWAFDITEKGVVRTAAKGTAEARGMPRPIIGNYALTVVAALAIAAAVWSWLREPFPGVPPITSIVVAALAIAVAVWSWLRKPSPGAPPISSIAVLPLDNLMGDPAQDYFVDGMHDALIANLSRLGALKVISRTSAMRYRDTDKRVPEIAGELGVDALVEGSVLKAGNRVRITAQLIHGTTDEHLWVNDYEADLTDILALQKNIAQAIASEIGLALKPEEEAYLVSAPQVNPEAYELYLRGWHFRTRETAEGTQKAVAYLEQAVAIDHSFARAYALLVWGYLMLVSYGVISSREARPKARAAIERALELDNSLPDAQVYLGLYLCMFEWDWGGAERAFKRAVELDPNHTHARFEYGVFLGRMGRFEEALVEVQRAKELDPLSLQADLGIGEVYLNNRQYDKAIEHYNRVLELDPGQSMTRYFLAFVYYYKSMYAEALEEYQKLGDRMGVMIAYYAMGRKTEALAYFDSLKIAGEQQGAGIDQILFFLWLRVKGDKEEALNLLEKAYQEHSWYMYAVKADPGFDFLRDDPRFQDLLRRLNFPE